MSVASSPVEELNRPLGPFASWRLGRQAAADGKRSLLPVNGSTPVTKTIEALATAAAARHAETARAHIGGLRTEIRKVEAALASTEDHLAKDQQQLASLPAQPDMNCAPPRAVPIDSELMKTLAYAKARTELQTIRAKHEQRVDQLGARRAELLARLATLAEQIEAAADHARAANGCSAAEANRRIAHYTVMLLRRHRDSRALEELLPLKKLDGDELLTPFLDLPVDRVPPHKE